MEYATQCRVFFQVKMYVTRGLQHELNRWKQGGGLSFYEYSYPDSKMVLELCPKHAHTNLCIGQGMIAIQKRKKMITANVIGKCIEQIRGPQCAAFSSTVCSQVPNTSSKNSLINTNIHLLVVGCRAFDLKLRVSCQYNRMAF